MQIWGLEFAVTEQSISMAIGVIPVGEQWYKRQSINKDYSQLLLLAHKDPDWSQGIQRVFLLEER